MIKNTKLFSGVFSALALMLVCSNAFAGTIQGTITYSPYVAQGIPALSDGMLIVLSLLFAIVAFRVLRRSAGKSLAMLVAVGIVALAAASGNKLVRNAEATISSFTFTQGGSPVNVYSTGVQGGQNTSGQPIRINSVNPAGCNLASATSSPYLPQCQGGLVVQNNGICFVNFEPCP